MTPPNELQASGRTIGGRALHAKALGGVAAGALAIVAAIWIVGAAGSDDGPAARRDFDFAPLETLPVQDIGFSGSRSFEKSLYTFAKEHVHEIAGDARYGGRHPIENLLSMVFETHDWLHQPFLEVRHPALKKVFDPDRRFKHAVPVTPQELVEGERQTQPGGWAALIWPGGDRNRPLFDSPESKAVQTELNHLFGKVDLLFGREASSAAPRLPGVGDAFRIVPAVDFRGHKDQWRTVAEVMNLNLERTPVETRVIESYIKMEMAFKGRQAEVFNAESRKLIDAIGELGVPTFNPPWKFSLDRWDGKFAPFAKSGWVYLISAILFAISYLGGEKGFTALFSRLGTGALAAGVALNLAALTTRGLLAGRMPVANLYESAVFIIGGVTVSALAISLFYRSKLVGMGGAALGALTMGMANFYIPGKFGKQVLPLIDALQSYWLNIHVTTMLASYALFTLAFFVSVVYLVRYLVLVARPGFLGAKDPTMMHLDSLNFRIITIGVPILTAGVIMGAIWASEAWGRPWAFDPKETASLITWMIYAFYLHARLFLGWRGLRGIWMSVAGFAAVVFTYLGVSFFLPGLHSYVAAQPFNFVEFIKKIVPGF
jgi:cytochrome c-type biogenesis protein CcsB